MYGSMEERTRPLAVLPAPHQVTDVNPPSPSSPGPQTPSSGLVAQSKVRLRAPHFSPHLIVYFHKRKISQNPPPPPSPGNCGKDALGSVGKREI